MLGWFSPHIFLSWAQRRLMEGGLPIFTYHKIGVPPNGTRDPFLYVSQTQFDGQLLALREAQYSSASSLTSTCAPIRSA